MSAEQSLLSGERPELSGCRNGRGATLSVSCLTPAVAGKSEFFAGGSNAFEKQRATMEFRRLLKKIPPAKFINKYLLPKIEQKDWLE